MFKSQIIGRIGADAEIKTNSNGKQYLAFSVAVPEKTPSGEQTTWFNCSGWGDRFVGGKTGEFIKKGDLIYLEGKVIPSHWVNKSGENLIQMNLLVNDLKFLGSSSPKQGYDPQPPVYASANITAPVVHTDSTSNQQQVSYEQPQQDDDLPF